MSDTLLLTKFFVPLPRPNLVLRSRLIEHLNEGIHGKLCLVSAPAGFGKTTLVAEWVSACEQPVAWLSLDEGDKDPIRFLTYLVAALQTILPKVGEGAAGLLQSPQPPAIESILTSLLNEISSVPDHFVLVLDDYHAIDARPVDELLTFLVEHLPARMHVLIATREDPPLPLARLRARGQLTELRAADLRFTPAEASDFLNQVMSLNLTMEDISALETRTEGWIAGLQLAALAMHSMQGREEPSNFIQAFTGSHHFVLDYLVEEVLQQQPEEIQTFLLRTSILDRMCGSLCDAVLGHTSASGQETLETLERANLFIIPLDSERRWYRYHHLFGDLLRQRLGKPVEFADLNLRASQWYEQNNDLGAAFQHAIASENFSRAVTLAEDAWEKMDESFQMAAWLGWVGKLPEEIIRVSPRLCTLLGRALTDEGQLEASELRLQDAERTLDSVAKANETQYNSLRAMIALVRAGNAQVVGDLTKTVKYAELALQLIPKDDFVLRAQAEVTLEFTHWTMGDLAGARTAMGNWMSSMQKAGNFVFVVASAFAVADIQIEQGQLREALTTYQHSIQLAAEHGKEAELVTAHHHLGLAMLYHEFGEDGVAAEYLQKAKTLGEQTTLVDWPYRWCQAQAQLEEDAGNLDAALVLLDEARRVYVRNPVPNIRPVDSLMARIHLKQGRLSMAQEWMHKQGLSVEDEVSYLQEFEFLTLVRLLIAEYSRNKAEQSLLEALNLLDRLLINAESQGRMGNVLASLITQALVHQAQGNLALALLPLERVLVLSQPEGYFRIFLNEGEPMRLLLLAFRSKIEEQLRWQDYRLHGFLNTLLTAFVRHEVMSQSSTTKQKSEIIESLSERELEVLRLIAQGLSNREISQRLFLAMSTVKGHNLKIFAKLQAQNRTEAVARARELGLI